jgi:hypothetical protein
LRDHPAFASLSVDISDTEALLGALQELPVPQAVIHAAGMMAAAPGNLDCGVSNALWILHVQACEVLFNHFAPECQQAVGLSPLAAGHPRRGWPLTVCRHQNGDGRNGQKLGGRTCASRHYRQCGGTGRDANPDAERTRA